MDPLTFIELLISLGSAAAGAFNKTGLVNLAAGIQKAVDTLIAVKNDPVTKAEVEAFRLSPKW
jgi:ABC-type taurine transport system ATPase subunit